LEVNYNNTKKGTAKRSFKGYECFFICKYQWNECNWIQTNQTQLFEQQ
jgi:hypothetical protein